MALGKALLAEAPASVLDEVVLDAWNSRTITDRTELEADLALTRKRGWALEDGELDVRRRSIGAVVRDHSGTAVAAIGVGSFIEELPDERLPELVGHVLSEAQKITDALGGALGAVEPPVPPVPRTDTLEGRRTPKRSRAGE